VLIKKSHITHIDLKKFYKAPISEDTSYSIVACEKLVPKVTFLVARSGFGDSSVGGDGWSKARYFYFANGALKYFATLSNSWSETHHETVEKFEFNGDRIEHINTYIRWENGKESAPRIKRMSYKRISYRWDGKDFIKIENSTFNGFGKIILKFNVQLIAKRMITHIRLIRCYILFYKYINIVIWFTTMRF